MFQHRRQRTGLHIPATTAQVYIVGVIMLWAGREIAMPRGACAQRERADDAGSQAQLFWCAAQGTAIG